MKDKIVLLGNGYFGNKIHKVLNNMDLYDVESYKSNVLYKDIDLNNVKWIFISTPNEFHYEHSYYFLASGINVFLEKPGTLSQDSLKELINLSYKNNVRLYIDDIYTYGKYDLSSKNFIYKKHSDSQISNVIDKICYHHIYLLYKENIETNIDVFDIQYINRYEIKFSILLNNEKYTFEYSLSNKNIEYINNILLYNDNNPLYDMIISVLNENVSFEENHKKSLFATNITKQIKNKIFENVAIVGGGVYGISAAVKLSDSGYNVTLFEKKNRLCESTSGINQFRVHRGYHYPRSKETIENCRNDEPSFSKFFYESISRPRVKHFYAIAKENSLVNAEEYVNILKENNLEWVDEGKFNNCDLLISVNEELYNPNILRELSYKRLYGCGVTVKTNTKWEKEYINDFDKVIYATYSNLNSLTNEDFQYQFEICEKPVVELPDEYKDLSIVIMDGPFMCFDPYCDTKYHLAGNVVHAIHSRNIGKLPIIPDNLKEYIDNGIIENPKVTNFNKFIESAKLFFPNIEKTKHIGSMYTIRTVLPYNEDTDTRPAIVRKINNKEFVLFSGKVVNCVKSAQKLLDLL